ncbi:MAG: hypothetical protein OXE52_20690 [Chloroflexi bacterium]|nr:hypothetical protein [Chloroflexota bacterium]
MISFARSRSSVCRCFLFFCVAALVAGCTLAAANPTVSAPTATALPPRPDAEPTTEILSSEELYRDDASVIGRTDPSFAALPVDAVLPPAPVGDSTRRVKVVLEDGAVLEGERYGFSVLRQPGILILSRDVSKWRPLTKRLAERGFIVLALETGGWLEAQHLSTILRSLTAISKVDAGWIAIIGADRSADLALLGCAVNELCDAAALLSPLSRDTLLNMLLSYGARPLWLAAARDDAEANAAARALARSAAGEAQFLEYDRGRGVELLVNQPEILDQLAEWLSLNLGG